MNIHDELKRLNAKCDRLAESLRRKNKFAAVTEGGAGESRPERPEPSQLLTPAISPQLSNRLTPETDAAIIDELDVELEAAGRGHWRGDTKMELLPADFARKLERERDEAREALQQWRDAAKGAENPHPDEVHCTCVPLLISKIAALRKERDEARDVLRIFADCRNWFHTAKEEGGPYTAWRGKREPDEIAEAALKEAAK